MILRRFLVATLSTGFASLAPFTPAQTAPLPLTRVAATSLKMPAEGLT